jgi:excisionase family DNA binding protein
MNAEKRESFLTVAEVAWAMRVSTATVYRLVKVREIPAVRFGRSYRISQRAVDDYIARAVLEPDGRPEHSGGI